MPVIFMHPWFFLLWFLIPVSWVLLRRSPLKRMTRRKRLVFTGLHMTSLLFLGTALADPHLWKTTDQVNLFFCLDRSQSIGPQAQKQAALFMSRAMRGMQADDRAGLVVFGREPFLESGLQRNPDFSTIQSRIDPHFTDIYQALQLAVGKLPPGGQNRIVLLSDGNENMQQAADMALLAKALGIRIFTVPLAAWFNRNEVFVEKLEGPDSAALQTPFELRLAVISSQATRGDLTLYRNDQIVLSRPLELKAGKNIIGLKETLKESGLHRYRAVVHAADDTLFENNEGLAFVNAVRKGNVLFLTDRPDSPLARALTGQGLNLVRIRPEGLPRSLYGLAVFDAVVLDNVDGLKIPYETMQSLEYYVRDLGGGLVMIGGENSFGSGHYLQTPVENVLPVAMDVPSDLEMSGICMVLVLDKSSSMTATYNEKSKLEMAKIAAFSTVELLNPVDQVGIVAFDTAFKWVVPVTRVTERQEIALRLSELKEGGGTDLFPALQDVHKVLKDFKAAKKHVIVLSDGMTEKASFKPLIQSMLTDRISVSTVSVGDGADIVLMRQIAQWGGGRAYFTDDPERIPRIFTDETKIAAKKIIVEKQMKPRLRSSAEMLRGIAVDLPMIQGQVLTWPKPDSHILMDTEEGPLLATAQFGLGRSVAFTSDLSGRWSRDWVLWDQYGRFAAQMVRWAQKSVSSGHFTAEITRRGGQGTMTVDILDPQNRFVNRLDLTLKALSPSGRDQALPFHQIAPGRYQGVFPAEEIGDYYLTLYEENRENAIYRQVFGFGVPYTEEFVNHDVNTELLANLARLTNGSVLDPNAQNPPNLFKADAGTKEYGAAIWPYLVLIFLLLLISMVVLRKTMA